MGVAHRVVEGDVGARHVGTLPDVRRLGFRAEWLGDEHIWGISHGFRISLNLTSDLSPFSNLKAQILEIW